jgi:hypothetical protein
MKQVFWVAILLSGLGIVASCRHELPAPANAGSDTTNTGNPGADTGICFERDIQPVFVTYCTRSDCHDPQSQSGGYIFTDYESIISKGIVPGNAMASLVYKDIANGSMPWYPNPQLSGTQKALIAAWINDGARNGTNCAPHCNNDITFGNGVQPLLGTYCIGCHNSAHAEGNVKLDSYNGVLAAAQNGSLLGTVKQQGYVAMPPYGKKLSACQATTIENWINAGALNN